MGLGVGVGAGVGVLTTIDCAKMDDIVPVPVTFTVAPVASRPPPTITPLLRTICVDDDPAFSTKPYDVGDIATPLKVTVGGALV